MAFLRNPFYKY